MATRDDLDAWVLAAIVRCGGEASVIEVARDIWRHHRTELEQSGDLLYTWQYDMRWAAQRLRHSKQLRTAEECPRGRWMLPPGRR
jgi:hypothetical protein